MLYFGPDTPTPEHDTTSRRVIIFIVVCLIIIVVEPRLLALLVLFAAAILSLAGMWFYIPLWKRIVNGNIPLSEDPTIEPEQPMPLNPKR
jgi:hypothetical protein